MKCLIIDVVSPAISEELGKYMQVDTKILPSQAELAGMIGDYEVLIMRVDPAINKEILDAAKNLKVIGVCSVGLNHIDMDTAKAKGIQVFNAPGLNGNAVAELTICKMLELSRHTIPAHRDVTVNEKWDKYAFVGRELRGKTLGVLGFGRIGKLLSCRLHGLGARVTATARRPEDLAWIRAYGYQALETGKLDGRLGGFGAVFNTVPSPVLGGPLLAQLPEDCLLMDLASVRGIEAAEDGPEVLWARSLPGRLSPRSAAAAIRDAVYYILLEE